MLPERFDNLLIRIGNPTLEHPVFYKCPVAIRFEIGGETPVYSDASLLRDTVVIPNISVRHYNGQKLYIALFHNLRTCYG